MHELLPRHHWPTGSRWVRDGIVRRVVWMTPGTGESCNEYVAYEEAGRGVCSCSMRAWTRWVSQAMECTYDAAVRGEGKAQ